MSQDAQQYLLKYLLELASIYERLTEERNFLMNNVQTRLDVVNTERQNVLTEAQEQLVKLNALRVAAGLPELTLQQLRDRLVTRRRPSAGG